MAAVARHRGMFEQALEAEFGRLPLPALGWFQQRGATTSVRFASLADARTISFESVHAVRRFPSFKGQKNFPGWYWSATEGRMIEYESLLEKSVLLRLDYDPEITAVAAQPFWLVWKSGARHTGRQWHCIDYFARHQSGRGELIDVKPAERVDGETFQASAEMTREAAGAMGCGYRVMSEPGPQVATNLTWLAGYRRPMHDRNGYLAALLDRCSEPTRFRDLVAAVGPYEYVAPHVWHQCWHHRLHMPLEERWTQSTLVSPGVTG